MQLVDADLERWLGGELGGSGEFFPLLLELFEPLESVQNPCAGLLPPLNPLLRLGENALLGRSGCRDSDGAFLLGDLDIVFVVVVIFLHRFDVPGAGHLGRPALLLVLFDPVATFLAHAIRIAGLHVLEDFLEEAERDG